MGGSLDLHDRRQPCLEHRPVEPPQLVPGTDAIRRPGSAYLGSHTGRETLPAKPRWGQLVWNAAPRKEHRLGLVVCEPSHLRP